MTAAELLAELQPLAYRARLERLTAWARAASEPDRAAVCDDFRGRGSYERHLALLASVVVRDEAGIAAATGDPSPAVRAFALAEAARRGQLPGPLHELPAADRRRIYRALRRHRRHDVADRSIEAVRANCGDVEAAMLLPACGPATVRRLLPGLEHLVHPRRLDPELLLDRLGERLSAGDAAAWEWAGDAIFRGTPERLFDLLERHAPGDRLPGELDAYGKLAAHDPDRFARLLTAPGRMGFAQRHYPSRALMRHLAVLPTEKLLPLARIYLGYDGSRLARLFQALPMSRRAEFYRAVAGAELVYYVLPLLPRELMHRLAETGKAAHWAAFLPWPRAKAAIEPGLRSSVPRERSEAYRLLLDSVVVNRDPAAAAEAVDLIAATARNEPDPVREDIIRHLSDVEPVLSAAAVPGLTAIVADALGARDLSARTRQELGALAAWVLHRRVGDAALTAWALSTMDGAGAPDIHPFDGAAGVADRLRPWAEAAMVRGRYEPLFEVAYSLGRATEGLADLLRRAAGPETPAAVARRAIEYWLADPRTRGDRVAEVLAADPTAVTIPLVWHILCVQRTDLLDRVLSGVGHGRFLEAGARWVPAAPELPERWLPGQRAAYVALLRRLIDDAGAPVAARASAVRSAARTPGPGRDVVRAHTAAPEQAIAEAALGALPWTDRPGEALPELLGYADHDRARVALYAAARAVRFVQPARLPRLLGDVLTRPAKITSQKVVARMLAEFGPPGGLDLLLSVHERPHTHPDVRAAIVAAARLRLELATSWAILERGARGSYRECWTVASADPRRVPLSRRHRYATLVTQVCRHSEPSIRAAGISCLPAWAPWLTDGRGLVEERLGGDLDSAITTAHVAGLLEVLHHLAPGAALGDLLVRLADQDAADHGADRPARRRLALLAEGAAALVRAEPLTAVGGRGAVPGAAAWLATGFRRLSDRPEHRRALATVLVETSPLDDLDELADLCAGRPGLAVRTATRVGGRSRQEAAQASPDPEKRAVPIRRLAARGDLAGGLYAVELVRAGERVSWRGRWRELALELRAHPDPDVRDEAYAIDLN